jgi:UrcA family protein
MKTLMLIGALFAMEVAVSAKAGRAIDGAKPARVKVERSDLDLIRQAGADAASPEIRNAALIVCGRVSDIREVGASQRRQACVTEQVKSIVRRINPPTPSPRYFQVSTARVTCRFSAQFSRLLDAPCQRKPTILASRF